MNSEQRTRALDLVLREALYLDQRRWDDWLQLYAQDCVFWMPMWKSETEPTADPEQELSFIYLQGRASLQERARRVSSGLSIASMPIPRTSHLVGPGLVSTQDGGQTVLLQSAFRSQAYLHKDNQLVEYAGRYTHVLQAAGDGYLIRQKTIFINCDYLQSKLDFFYI
ncbi:MAG: aromatic-ring-hydroxylating dioxygenase subunit beta [Burkholderiaceae bacterium]|nr:aromatic-ring-hydroxylating dioxygenase subunit beta [Burkholderiaceae bacterium]